MGAELLDFELAVLPHLAGHLPVAIPEPVFTGGPVEHYPYRFAGFCSLDPLKR